MAMTDVEQHQQQVTAQYERQSLKCLRNISATCTMIRVFMWIGVVVFAIAVFLSILGAIQ